MGALMMTGDPLYAEFLKYVCNATPTLHSQARGNEIKIKDK